LETEEPEPLPVLTAEQAAATDVVALSNSIAVLEGMCGSLTSARPGLVASGADGPSALPSLCSHAPTDKIKSSKPNLSVIQQYAEMERDYLSRVADLNAVTAQRDQVKAAYDELRKRRLDTFMAGFTQITLKLKEMYQMITLGGNAELELVDSLDPFSEGIVFSVMPPKKSWKNIANLSGGEKVRAPLKAKRQTPRRTDPGRGKHLAGVPRQTLSSLALVFALHHYKPTPLYVMDEIDAALDFRNVSIVANYIKVRTAADVAARRMDAGRAADAVSHASVHLSTLRPRSGRGMRSSSSSRSATTCLSWRTGWWASTRQTRAPSPSPSTRPGSPLCNSGRACPPPFV